MPWTCSKCDRTLSRPNAWHQCIRKSIETLFERKDPVVYQLYTQVQKGIKGWKNVKWSATQNCIVYINESTFLIIKPMRTCLELKFSLSESVEAFPVYKAQQWGKRVWHLVRLYENGDVDEAVWKLLKRSYNEDRSLAKS
ncbi:MAG TPA: DUF5655 domain-containing protein [Flavisolibacter sp.]|nr:DUF5655 domain-containing protein [Flavisolibacter sp.]